MAEPDRQPDHQPAAPPFALDKSELVTLLVGPDEHELAVHESCITRNSEFFKVAMKKQWTEGQTRVIKLPEEPCVETMRHYINFNYGQKLPTYHVVAGGDDAAREQCYTILGRLYVLAERFLDKTTQNEIMKEFLRVRPLDTSEGFTWSPIGQRVADIYEGTSPDSPARRLMVDLHLAFGREDWIVPEDSHPTFLSDLSRGLMANITGPKAGRIARWQVLAPEDYFS